MFITKDNIKSSTNSVPKKLPVKRIPWTDVAIENAKAQMGYANQRRGRQSYYINAQNT